MRAKNSHPIAELRCIRINKDTWGLMGTCSGYNFPGKDKIMDEKNGLFITTKNKT